jgi:hypothetical protein
MLTVAREVMGRWLRRTPVGAQRSPFENAGNRLRAESSLAIAKMLLRQALNVESWCANVWGF